MSHPVEEHPVPGIVPRFEIPGWRERFGVVAGITGRGAGEQPFDMGLWTGQPVGEVMTRWRELRSAEPGFPAHVLGTQVHQTRVLGHKEAHPGWTQVEGVDGHTTDARGLMLYVTVADCVPVYLVNPKTGGIALLHAAWRGVAGGMLERGVEVLSHRKDTVASDIVMHCGISICGACYEVGSEVIEALGLAADGAGKAQADLRALLVEQARRLGIREVSVSSWCSAHDRDRFFSHRASRGADGRMVAYLGLPVVPAPDLASRPRQD